MAVSLKSLQRKRSTAPPRIMIYGPPGMGKTTLAGEFPDPYFIQTEDGAPSDLDIASLGIMNSYADVYNTIVQLCSEDHDYKTVVVDSVDKLEALIWQSVCEAHKVASIEDIGGGYGKGYIAADKWWADSSPKKEGILDGLNVLRTERGMNVILLAHSEVKPFNDPRTAAYDRYQIRLNKRAVGIISDEMDMVMFLNNEPVIQEEKQKFNAKRTHAEGGMTRWMYVEGRPSFDAKNRYGMKSKMPYVKGRGYETLSAYFPSVNGGNQPIEPAEAESVAA